MMTKIFIWFYIIFILPPLLIIMAGLTYGGVTETVKMIKSNQKK